MKTIPKPETNRYIERGEAKAMTNVLSGALDQWLYRPGAASHTWLLGDWKVVSSSLRSHVDITMPGGIHILIHLSTAAGVIAVLKEYGAPLNMRGIGETGYEWTGSQS